MNYRLPAHHRSHHFGVTLIELLVVMAVIGILIGILVPVLGPMVKRASEHAIITETKQLDMAIEQFNTEYGFYPPDFTEINSANDFLPYLNVIAPNHTELSADPGGSGLTRVERWWAEVGTNLNPSNALVFWLSGIRKSAQYPLTDAATGTPAVAFANDLGTGGERKEFFEFKSNRLRLNATQTVASYGQAKGNKSLPYIYFNDNYAVFDASTGEFEMKFIDSSLFMSSTDRIFPYLTTPGFYTKTAYVPTEFRNPNKFQIIAPGLDNRYGDYNTTGDPNWTLNPQIRRHRDNIVNYSEGRLDKDLY